MAQGMTRWMVPLVLSIAMLFLAGDARASLPVPDDGAAGTADAAHRGATSDDGDLAGPFASDRVAPAGAASAMGFPEGSPELSPGRHTRWIDRLALPDWGRELYDLLAEGSDGDGIGDFLIDDGSFAPATEASGFRDHLPGRVVTHGNGTYLVVAEVDAQARPGSLGDVVFAVAGCFEFDHPEVFWLSSTTRYATVDFATTPEPTRFLLLCLRDGDDGYDLRDGDYRSRESIERDIALRDRRVGELVALARSRGSSSYEQVRLFHDWLVESNDYNASVWRREGAPSPSAYTSIAALKGRVGMAGPVCDGYAKAFKVLCDAAAIPCVFVRGTVTVDGATIRHGWNAVRIDGAWYAVDVTWDDPPAADVQPPKSGRETGQYLLVGSGTPDGAGRDFSSHHRETADFAEDGTLRLSNGPELAKSAYRAPGREPVAVYRLFDPRTGEHLFTTSATEYRALPNRGWRQEGVAWYGIRTAGVPVYRLFDPRSGDHHYTADSNEYAVLGRNGWLQERVAWYADDARGIPVQRLNDPANPGPGAHHFVTDARERESLVAHGWTYEGVAFFGSLR